MYVFKYAMISVRRSLVRNILVGFLMMVVTASSIVALTIRHAADGIVSLQEERFDLTASLLIDRNALRATLGSGGETMRTMLSSVPILQVEELLGYADSSYVQSLSYSLRLELGSTELVAVGEEESADAQTAVAEGKDGTSTGSGSNERGSFAVTGYTDAEKISQFADGQYVMVEGSAYTFEENSTQVLISEELAMLNGLSSGDEFTLESPTGEGSPLRVTVGGIFADLDMETGSSWFSSSANHIIGQYAFLQEWYAATSLNMDSPIVAELNHTFHLASGTTPDIFAAEVEQKGVSPFYTLRTNAGDLDKIMQPLMNLISFSAFFLWLVLGIGAFVFLVLNMITIRERKYEIGVLRSMGMKKHFVAIQFMTELVLVATIAMALGVAAGNLASEPVANHMLRSEIDQVIAEQETLSSNMGSGQGQGQGQRSLNTSNPEELAWVREIQTPLNPIVLLQVLIIGLCILLLGSGLSLVAIARVEPLKILSNRT